MLRLGLTGGIGSGKSTVARMLAERGAVVIDADAISRQLVEPGEPALDRLVEEFGPGILREDGSLNRGALAQAAFGDATAAARLNEIMHPAIRAESERRIADAVGGRTTVLFDSGIRRGTHIAKALALGAEAVMVGRAYLWGLAADGERGVAMALRLLTDELSIAIGSLGLTSIGELRRRGRDLLEELR